MSTRSVLLAALALALVSTACQPAAEEAATTEADLQAIKNVIEQEIAAANAGDAERFLGILSDDVVIMPPNEQVVRGEQAGPWLRAFLDQFAMQLEPYSNEQFVVAGDWAFHLYSYEWTLTPKAGGEPITDKGKGIHILQRQPDGSWLLAVDAWSSDLPPAQVAGPLSEEDVAAIRAVFEENEQAGLAGDWESFLSHFTEDAVIMWPNSPAVEGLEAIKGVNWVRAIEVEHSIVQIDGQGDLAFVRGTLSLLLDYEGAVKDEDKFLYILRKQPDGSWLFANWISNSDLPLPEEGSGT